MHKIIRSDRFEKEVAKMVKNHEMVKDFVAGVEWVLSHDPTAGTRMLESNVWCISVNPSPQLPRATVYYTFGNTYVVLVSINVTERNGDGKY